jgi:hypothetical protein
MDVLFIFIHIFIYTFIPLDLNYQLLSFFPLIYDLCLRIIYHISLFFFKKILVVKLYKLKIIIFNITYPFMSLTILSIDYQSLFIFTLIHYHSLINFILVYLFFPSFLSSDSQAPLQLY